MGNTRILCQEVVRFKEGFGLHIIVTNGDDFGVCFSHFFEDIMICTISINICRGLQKGLLTLNGNE